jgi:PP-loop superfamily ATP-utilizing enzyme
MELLAQNAASAPSRMELMPTTLTIFAPAIARPDTSSKRRCRRCWWAEIRMLSRHCRTSDVDRPASACLSSRILYGVPVTPTLLSQVERAEAALRELGFRQFRVRAHGELARIELAPDELSHGLQSEVAEKIARGVKGAGFTFVTIDLEGYRQGSLNSLLKPKE